MRKHDAVQEAIAIAVQTEKEAHEFLIDFLLIGGVSLGWAILGIFWLSMLIIR